MILPPFLTGTYPVIEPLVVEESRRTEEPRSEKGPEEEPSLREEKVIIHKEKVIIDKEPFLLLRFVFDGFLFFHLFNFDFLNLKLLLFFTRTSRAYEGENKEES